MRFEENGNPLSVVVFGCFERNQTISSFVHIPLGCKYINLGQEQRHSADKASNAPLALSYHVNNRCKLSHGLVEDSQTSHRRVHNISSGCRWTTSIYFPNKFTHYYVDKSNDINLEINFTVLERVIQKIPYVCILSTS